MRRRLLFVLLLGILGTSFVQAAFATTSPFHWGVNEGDRMSFGLAAFARSPQGELLDEVHEDVIMEVESLPLLPQVMGFYFADTSYYWANESSFDLTFYFDMAGVPWGYPYAALALYDWTAYSNYVNELAQGVLSELGLIQDLFQWGVIESIQAGTFNVSYTTTWYKSDGSLKGTHVFIEAGSVDTEVILTRLDGPSDELILYAIGAAAIVVVIVIIIGVRRRR